MGNVSGAAGGAIGGAGRMNTQRQGDKVTRGQGDKEIGTSSPPVALSPGHLVTLSAPLRRDRRELIKGLACISPWIIGFSLFTLVPVLMSLNYSVRDYSLLQRGAPVFIGMSNYRELFSDPVFWKSVRVTAIYVAIALPAGMMISVGLALMLNTKIKCQSIYRTIIFLPSLVPVVASAMIWMWLLNSKLGLINVAMEAMGLNNLLARFHIQTPIPWITDEYWVIPSLAMITIWGCGQTVTIYLAGLQDVPTELYEAAEIDGAGPIRRLFNVTLPMLSPVIFFNLIMALIGSIQFFTLPIIMTKGEPARASYFFTMYLYDNAFVYLRMGYASAMAWIQLIVILILTGVAFWTSRRWVHYQGK
jgi:multiple sugar transport system permease protein